MSSYIERAFEPPQIPPLVVILGKLKHMNGKRRPSGKILEKNLAPGLVLEGLDELVRTMALSTEDRNAEIRADSYPVPAIVDGLWISAKAANSLSRAAALAHKVHGTGISLDLWTRKFLSVAVRDCLAAYPSANLTTNLTIDHVVASTLDECKPFVVSRWHYFPTLLFRDESASSFALGPIQFMRGSAVRAFAEAHSTDETTHTPNVPADDKAIETLCTNDWVAAVEITGSDRQEGRSKGVRLVRLALAGIDLLLGDTQSPTGVRMLDGLMPLASQQRVSERQARFHVAYHSFRGAVGGPPGFVLKLISGNRVFCDWLGDCIETHRSPIETCHPKMKEKWLTALFWYASGRDSLDDFAAMVDYGAALDVALGEGKGVPAIESFLGALLKKSNDEMLISYPPLTLHEVVELIYGDGRSKIIHGGIPALSSKFSTERAVATSATRLALLLVAEAAASYTIKYSLDDWGVFRQGLISAFANQ